MTGKEKQRACGAWVALAMLCYAKGAMGFRGRVGPLRAAAGAAEVDLTEAAKVFGRLAEKAIYLDPAVGACCHSACSDCEWRKPDGGYRFDLIRAGRPKWVPCYTFRDFKDERGSHTPQWTQMFADDGELTKGEFFERLEALKFNMPMGPSGFLTGQPATSEDVLEVFWAVLMAALAEAKGESAADLEAISADDFILALQQWSTQDDVDEARGPDFVDWNMFKKALA